MSATGERLRLADAEAVAKDLLGAIGGEAHLVGSIRRRQPTVGDIELLVHKDADLERLPLSAGPLLPGRYEVVKGGVGAWRYCQLRHRERGFKVDLYRFDDQNRGSLMVIRTGPAAFSRSFVTALRRHGLAHRDGYVTSQVTGVISCPDEETAFRLAGMAWVDPEERE